MGSGLWCSLPAPEIKARLTVVKDGAGDEGQLGLVLGLAGVQRSSLFARDAATTRWSKALWVLHGGAG